MVGMVGITYIATSRLCYAKHTFDNLNFLIQGQGIICHKNPIALDQRLSQPSATSLVFRKAVGAENVYCNCNWR